MLIKMWDWDHDFQMVRVGIRMISECSVSKDIPTTSWL